MALNNVLTSYIELCDAYIKFKQTNQSCPPSKLANQSMLYGALLIQRVNYSFSEIKKNFAVWSKKHRDKGSEKYISIRFR